MVFLSDGYRAEELNQFIQDVHSVTSHFFRQSPFKEYQSYFNLLAIRVPSNQSGAKKEPSDVHDTFFGSTYNYAGIERLLVAENLVGALDILVQQVPLFDQAVLIVNDMKYGGSGGWLATTSVHPDAPEIALHEIGHSFAGLADEYWAGDQFAGERPNMSRETNPDLIRWRNWLNDEGVGVYPHEENPTWFRPHQNCKMRVLNPDFCAVCRESIVKRIHNLSDPIVTFDPDNREKVTALERQSFRIDFLEPSPNTLQVDWYVGENRMDAYDSLVIDRSVGVDSFYVQVFVVDSTRYVRDGVHQQNHTFGLQWDFAFELSTFGRDWNQTFEIGLSPNPVTENLTISFESPESIALNLKCIIFDDQGKISLQTQITSPLTVIPVSGLIPGSYGLLIFSEQGIFTGKFLKT